MKPYIALLLSIILPFGQAADTASVVMAKIEPVSSSFSGMVFSLFALVLIAGGLYWFTRRFLVQRLGAGRRMQSMRVVSVTMLGPKEKIVMLETREGEVLVLGVTSHQISLLDKRTLDNAIDK